MICSCLDVCGRNFGDQRESEQFHGRDVQPVWWPANEFDITSEEVESIPECHEMGAVGVAEMNHSTRFAEMASSLSLRRGLVVT